MLGQEKPSQWRTKLKRRINRTKPSYRAYFWQAPKNKKASKRRTFKLVPEVGPTGLAIQPTRGGSVCFSAPKNKKAS
ncbi:hypothetical protein VXM60_03465 [Shewanella khirikhana]|uniref:hypothetical protein n=1 Tax=Shewanella khirikhana TaxID=1965282 RepID=UPI0030CB60DA